MTPGAFDPETAREVIGDERARDIEAKARKDADSSTFDPPSTSVDIYWSSVQKEMESVLYCQQYVKRHFRNQRKS